MSVIQEKMKSVGFWVTIQSIRISTNLITMTGEKSTQPGDTKGDIFICRRAIQFFLPFYELQTQMYLHKNICIFKNN